MAATVANVSSVAGTSGPVAVPKRGNKRKEPSDADVEDESDEDSPEEEDTVSNNTGEVPVGVAVARMQPEKLLQYPQGRNKLITTFYAGGLSQTPTGVVAWVPTPLDHSRAFDLLGYKNADEMIEAANKWRQAKSDELKLTRPINTLDVAQEQKEWLCAVLDANGTLEFSGQWLVLRIALLHDKPGVPPLLAYIKANFPHFVDSQLQEEKQPVGARIRKSYVIECRGIDALPYLLAMKECGIVKTKVVDTALPLFGLLATYGDARTNLVSLIHTRVKGRLTRVQKIRARKALTLEGMEGRVTVAYTAGMFDVRGSVRMERNSVTAVLLHTCEPLLEMVKKTVCGGNGSISDRLKLWGENAATLLQKLEPQIRVKNNMVGLALHARTLRENEPVGKEHKKSEEYHRQMQRLKDLIETKKRKRAKQQQ